MDYPGEQTTDSVSSASPEAGNYYTSQNLSSRSSIVNIARVSISPSEINEQQLQQQQQPVQSQLAHVQQHGQQQQQQLPLLAPSMVPPPQHQQQPAQQQTYDKNSKRKRKRLTISCLTCRKRKIKCDRQKPCSSCVKNNVPAHLCIYDESPWVSSLINDNRMTDELLNLKQENEHLTGLLKMNEQELNNLKNLLVDLKISGNEGGVKENDQSIAIQQNNNSQVKLEYEAKREEFLLQQPINIGQFSCFKQTKFLVKIFGPSSWQNFVLDDLKTSYMLDSCIPYIMDLISKNERRLEQLKIVKLRLFNETKIDEPKLKEIERYLGDYQVVTHNVEYFVSVHRSTTFLSYVDDDKLINDFHNIIKKSESGNNCYINIDLNSPNSYVELANLASLLLILRISVIIQDTSFESDKDERLVSYAAHLFSSMMILEQPTVPAIMALAIFESYHVYNPLDFGAEIIPHGTSRDWSMCLLIAVNSALKLGLHTKVPSQYDKSHYNYISPHHLREFWRSIMYMDFTSSLQNGLPFAMTGYSDNNEPDKESILLKKIDDDPPLFLDIICHQRITTFRSVAMKFSTANQNHSKMSSKNSLDKDTAILKEFVMRTRGSNLSLLKILDPFNKVLLQDFMIRIVTLDVLISMTYTLYLSFCDPNHILNSNIDKQCFLKQNNVENFNLVKRYYNATLITALYGMRLCSFFLEKVYSDPFWSRNLVLQFLTLKHVKQLCMKSSSLLLILLIRNTKAKTVDPLTGKIGVQFESNFHQPDVATVDIFNMPFDNLENLAMSPGEKYEFYNVENDQILKNTIDITVNLFKTISLQKSFLTIDRKWYISMELCYTSILYCFQNCPVVYKNFNWVDYNNQQDFANFKKFYNVDDVNFFRKQNYLKNKNEIMKINSLLN